MHEQLLELAETPPNIDRYEPYVQYGCPILIYGTPIRNEYDHERLCINEKYNPVRVRSGDRCFYGLLLQPTKLMEKLCNVTNRLPMDHPEHVDMYKKRLALCGLTCDSCWAHLDENIFPIDAKNLPRLTINSRYIRTINSMLLESNKNQLPWFTRHAQMKIFLIK